MTAEILCKVVKWLMGHIFDDNHAGIARQLLPVQPLEGLFSKTIHKVQEKKMTYLIAILTKGDPMIFISCI